MEIEALDPTDLRALIASEIDTKWDVSAFEAVLALEKAEREYLRGLAAAER